MLELVEPGLRRAAHEGRGVGRNRRGNTVTVSAGELAARVRTTTGLRLGNGTAAMFLAWWLTTGVVVELLPGRYTLTAKGQGLASGLLTADDEERAAWQRLT